MSSSLSNFDESRCLHRLQHLLPSQAPLKDFVHHNTLHAFQDQPFHEALLHAKRLLGYTVYPSRSFFLDAYKAGKITDETIDQVIAERHGSTFIEYWRPKLFSNPITTTTPLVGRLRSNWKTKYNFDLNQHVHPKLFRLLANYLDQGIAESSWQEHTTNFFSMFKNLEKKSLVGFLQNGGRAKKLIQLDNLSIPLLLGILVGDCSWYDDYLMDQQFSHPGWSGMVSYCETNPGALLRPRTITLKELIMVELLLEIDALDRHFKERWKPMCEQVSYYTPINYKHLNKLVATLESDAIWLIAYETQFYESVLGALQLNVLTQEDSSPLPNYQAIFCIDDRECSIRRHLELTNPNVHTYGTPGHFNLPIRYKPHGALHSTKVCPGPATPTHLIKEGLRPETLRSHAFDKQTHQVFQGTLLGTWLGFKSTLSLASNLFFPDKHTPEVASNAHMDPTTSLTILRETDVLEESLLVGFTYNEMATIVSQLLKSIGLTTDFGRLVYLIGHGASSTNNTHFAGYDCGACSGRPGSVNARVFATMANYPQVRALLMDVGIHIPSSTTFIGALHDTTRDEITYYDTEVFTPDIKDAHQVFQGAMEIALQKNAKERSRRLALVNTSLHLNNVHLRMKRRAVALYEPRPELNHATNALCIVGSRKLSQGVFLDRRAFLNSYNHQLDPNGDVLASILKAATPVCGGINLEYYFSFVDNERLGAGSKLSHNVTGLIGVANGTEGDLRTGLPLQMIEVHDPIRMCFIIEQLPEIILAALASNASLAEWYTNEWVNLYAIHPINQTVYRYVNKTFRIVSHLSSPAIYSEEKLQSLIENNDSHLPISLVK